MPNTSPDIFQVDSIVNCPAGYFDLCLVFPDINWIIVKFKASLTFLSSLIQLQIAITQLPASTKRTNIQF